MIEFSALLGSDSFVPFILKQKKVVKSEFLKEMEIDAMTWPTKL